MFNFIRKKFKKAPAGENLTEAEELDRCVETGLLTEEEKLRILYERYGDRLKEVLADKKKKEKKT